MLRILWNGCAGRCLNSFTYRTSRQGFVVRLAAVAHCIQEFIVDVPAVGLPGDGDAKSVESAVGDSASTRANKQRLLRR